jgi:hypothetical protein
MGAYLRLHPETAREELSLALFAVPQFMEEATTFALSRRTRVDIDLWPEPVAPYRAEDIQLFVFAKAMLKEDGFMQQLPEYYERLVPDARSSLDDEFPDAVGDWAAIRAACAKRYDDSINRIDQWLTDTGPKLSAPKARIFDILDDDPLDFRVAFGQILVGRVARCEPG